MVNPSNPADIPRPTGLILAPFRGLRYDPSRVGLADVLAPPYDIIDEPERVSLEARSPQNVVRLTLPRDDSGQPGSGYRRAADLLAKWRRDGILRPDPEPALYVYEQRVDGHVQRGIVGALGLTPPEDGIVLPHENTMAGPVADRLALMTAVDADLEPIFLVYDGGGAASGLVAGIDAREPVLTTTTDDGTEHRLWAVTDAATLAGVAADLAGRRAVIADGHHRYATFRQYQQERHERGDGAGAWDLGLALLVDGSAFGPQVHAIHRVIPGLPADEAARRASEGMRVTPIDGELEVALDTLDKAGLDGTAFVLSDGTRHWLLSEPDGKRVAAALPTDRSAAWRGLDVTVAHLYLIRELWGLDDREGVVDYRHDVASAIGAATQTSGTALLLNPTPIADVAAVAAAGDRMPRKSTLFVPKPATGVVMRAFEDA